LRLLLDEMLDREIAMRLRERGHDVRAVQEEPSLRGVSDEALLRAAAEMAAVVVTDNVADFARLHARFCADGEDHHGLLLASPSRFPRSKRTVGLWVQALDTVLVELGPNASLRNDCHWLQRLD
jgi:hypothetical protein